jgi:hypothetical protein
MGGCKELICDSRGQKAWTKIIMPLIAQTITSRQRKAKEFANLTHFEIAISIAYLAWPT